MNVSHILAVFRAEYYTTTYRFRRFRNLIPLFFLLGVLFFSFLLRSVYQLFLINQSTQTPSITIFFSIIAIFSYFILFAPVLSPLGKIVYDSSGQSRREVALNTPVSNKDLLYGNLLSNLVFFLPFFSFIGTLALSPFLGSGTFTPLTTSIFLFIILSLLILLGLVSGTLLAPLIFNFISSQNNTYARSLVSLLISAMLILALPLLRFFLENVSFDGNSLGVLSVLPFTVSAILIVYILYGVELILPKEVAFGILIIYVLAMFLIAYLSADALYNLFDREKRIVSSYPKQFSNRFVRLITQPIPANYRSLVQATIKASIRDIEHLSRLTIGISITIFMVFALSGRGLFRSVTSQVFEEIEFAIVIFALVISSASVIFIEVSSFVVQHKDMFALIKSAPKGPQKFIYAKSLQMFYVLTPLFSLLIFTMTGFGLISLENVLPLFLQFILVIAILIGWSLFIYTANPADNEEDLTNFINLLVFYFLSFLLATVPVFLVLSDIILHWYHVMLMVITAVIIIVISLKLSIHLLEKMNLETLDSNLSKSIHQIVKTIGLFFTGWIFVPSLSIAFLLIGISTIQLVIVSLILTLVVPAIFYSFGNLSVRKLLHLKSSYLKNMSLVLVVMVILGVIVQILHSFFFDSPSTLFVDISTIELMIILLLSVMVEELFFRGMLLDYAKGKLSTQSAILLSSLLFGLVHLLTLASAINAFFQGIILSHLRIKTSLTTTITVHLVYNIVVILIFAI